jgi:hypothetical protein
LKENCTRKLALNFTKTARKLESSNNQGKPIGKLRKILPIPEKRSQSKIEGKCELS